MSDKYKTLPEWIKRGIADLFPFNDYKDPDQNLGSRLDESLVNKKPLRVKLGIDPTGSEIHLGHGILFRKLRAFQDAGHTAVLIIGDFTARIGDPSGKSNTRVQLNSEQVEKNAQTYLSQLGLGNSPERSLLDFVTPGRLEIRRNSEWLADLDLTKIIELLSRATVGQMLAKEDFGNRYSKGVPISMHEFLYPLLQGYDSVIVKADVELGGIDQKFNVAMGRDLQRQLKQRTQFGLLLPILVGLDGAQKMSKSLGNFVGLNEDPVSMYSKLEKVPDSSVMDYITLLTNLNKEDLPSDPRLLQQHMALTITASRHGWEIAKEAQSDSERLVSGSRHAALEIPEVSMAEVKFPAKAFYLLGSVGICVSSSEARRQIKGGAIRLDGKKITDPNVEFSDKQQLVGKVLQLGKKTFRRLAL